MKRCVRRVAPVASRVLIFTTDATSYHGHPEPMRCPEGVARRSLALYYFSVEEDPLVRSTDYRARPGDGARSVLIYGDKQMLRAYDWAKRRLGLSDQTASTIFGLRERLRRNRRPPQAERSIRGGRAELTLRSTGGEGSLASLVLVISILGLRGFGHVPVGTVQTVFHLATLSPWI